MQFAKDFMSTAVLTIRPDQTIRDAIELILIRRISGLPVVDDQNRLLGIISEFALLNIAYDPSSIDDLVLNHMTPDPISVTEDASMTEVANQVICHRIGRLPVVRSGRLVGIITRSDVLRAAMQTRDATAVS